MKRDYSSVEHFKTLIALALDVDEAFDEASRSECTCGSDPESPCRFCSKWEKAERKLNEFKELVERGLGYD